MPIEDVDSVVIHGSGQMTTQALHLCSSRGIPVQWYSMGGKFMAGTQSVSETFKHPHTGTSVEYARIVELECRLLEKEWSGYPGEFGKMRLR